MGDGRPEACPLFTVCRTPRIIRANPAVRTPDLGAAFTETYPEVRIVRMLKPSSVGGVAAAIAALAIAFSVGASGMRRPAPPEPVIAVVDLNGVLEGLVERTEREAVQRKRIEKFQTDIDAMSAQIEDIRSRLEVASPADKPALQEELAIVTVRRTAQARVSEELLKADQGKILAELYKKISTSAAELARQAGYTLVLASDASAPMPPADVDAVHQAATLRRVLYAQDGHDITQELIDFMNNRHAAGN